MFAYTIHQTGGQKVSGEMPGDRKPSHITPVVEAGDRRKGVDKPINARYVTGGSDADSGRPPVRSLSRIQHRMMLLNFEDFPESN